MLSESELHVIGIRRMTEDWPFNMEISRDTWPYRKNIFSHFQDDEPIEKLDINEYDLLIDVAESNDYNPKWRETAIKWNVPRIIYITNPAPKTSLIRRWHSFTKILTHSTDPIFHYYRKLKGCPIVYSNEMLQRDWGLEGTIIHFTFDEWGIGGWIGDKTEMLFGKNGYYTWAPPSNAPTQIAELFKELEKRFGDKLTIHDSSKDPMDEWMWRNYVAHHRLWFEHDFGSTGRALTQGVVKAMCLGCPVVLWKTKICQGWRFIRNKFNGLVTQNVDEVVNFAEALFYDYYYAKALSENMIRAYRKNLSWAVAKPKWEKAMKQAFEQYEKV